jgi:hypothetical protein
MKIMTGPIEQASLGGKTSAACLWDARMAAELEETAVHLAREFRALVRDMEELRHAHRLGSPRRRAAQF